MTREYLVSWSIGTGASQVGGNAANPSWSDIERLLESAWDRSGTVEIHNFAAAELGPQSLQTRIMQKRAIITLQIDTENDAIVRTYSRGNSGYMVEILGDMWDSSLVCSEYELICAAFREFFETGDVSHTLLGLSA